MAARAEHELLPGGAGIRIRGWELASTKRPISGSEERER
jgi:hypothetical protein